MTELPKRLFNGYQLFIHCISHSLTQVQRSFYAISCPLTLTDVIRHGEQQPSPATLARRGFHGAGCCRKGLAEGSTVLFIDGTRLGLFN